MLSSFLFDFLWYNYGRGFQGVAQLVARAVRDCEVVGSNPITLTTFDDYYINGKTFIT